MILPLTKVEVTRRLRIGNAVVQGGDPGATFDELTGARYCQYKPTRTYLALAVDCCRCLPVMYHG